MYRRRLGGRISGHLREGAGVLWRPRLEFDLRKGKGNANRSCSSYCSFLTSSAMELANSHAEEILYKCRKCADASLDWTTGVQEQLSKFSFYVPLFRM